MTLDEAAHILWQMYDDAPYREQATRIILFGVEYNDELDGLSIPEIVRRAGIYKTTGSRST